MLLITTVCSVTVKLLGEGAGWLSIDIVLTGKAVPSSIKAYLAST